MGQRHPEELTDDRRTNLGDTGVVLKASEGLLVGWYITNSQAAVRYVKVYDKATAPTSADTPVLTILVPASSQADFVLPNGARFTSGISVRAVTEIADAGTTGAAANDLYATFFYK